jgi:nucleotide-binding universal stress UspA family protein
MRNRILVAADGGPEPLGALRMAAQLVEHRGCDATVLAVLDAVGAYTSIYSDMGGVLRTHILEGQAEAILLAVTKQAHEVGALPVAEDARVEIGPAARTIVRTAHELGAELIVLGMGVNSVLERWFGRHTTLQVVQFSHVPVLAVPADRSDLPRRALVAVDFSPLSLDALKSVRSVLAEGAELHLVHVVPGIPDIPLTAAVENGAWLEGMAEAAEEMHERLRQLAVAISPSGLDRVETHLLQGDDPAAELLSLAERLEVDLIATGSHGHGFWGRLVLGSVSAHLLRTMRCAIFVAPPRTLPVELAQPLSDESTLPRREAIHAAVSNDVGGLAS